MFATGSCSLNTSVQTRRSRRGTWNFKLQTTFFLLTLTSSPFPPYAREIGKAMKPRSSLGLALFIASAPWNNGGSRQAVSGFHQPAAFRNFQQKSQSSILLPTTRYELELNKGRAWGRAGRCWPDGVFTWCRLSCQTLSAIIFSALAQRRASFSSRGRKISLQQRRSLIRSGTFLPYFFKNTPTPRPSRGPLDSLTAEGGELDGCSVQGGPRRLRTTLVVMMPISQKAVLRSEKYKIRGAQKI